MLPSSVYARLSPKAYSALCAASIGLINLVILFTYNAHLFTVESVIHSVHSRDPDKVGPTDGYYGMAVSNVFFMLSTMIVPSLSNYMRCKWMMVIATATITLYYISFQFLHRYLYFAFCSILGFGLASFNVGYLGYITESSTKQTLPSNMALYWALTSASVLVAGFVNFLMARANSEGSTSHYREFSEGEVRIFFGMTAGIGVLSTALYAFLPNKNVDESISKTCERTTKVKDQLTQMLTVLVNRRILILVPFYIYVGLFYIFWTTIIPTTFQFTMILSKNAYVPLFYGISFTAGNSTMCFIVMKLSYIITNFCNKPLMIISACLHLSIFALVICIIPEWSTVRHTNEPSLLIQPSIISIVVLAFFLGAADLANNNMRSVRDLSPTPRNR
ncbi:hypothetical protein PMAYCL1PPCAC_25738, partial [Pristionchus mayeri]